MTLRQTGDTIVEVMVTLTILALALSISYATADRSLLNERQAEESSTATEYAQSQVEQLVNYVATNDALPVVTLPNYEFCFNASNQYEPNQSCSLGSIPYVTIVYDCDDLNGTGACVGTSNTSDTFVVVVTWPDVLGQGNDTSTLVYQIHPEPKASGGVVGPTNTAWSWTVNGGAYSNCTPFGDDSYNPEPHGTEDSCDPPGGPVADTVIACYYGVVVQDRQYNNEQFGVNGPMFAKRDVIATYPVSSGTFTGVTTGTLPTNSIGNQITVSVNFNQYEGDASSPGPYVPGQIANTPPPAGGLVPINPGVTLATDPDYAFTVDLFANTQSNQIVNLMQLDPDDYGDARHAFGGSTDWTQSWTPITRSQTFTITIPPNTTHILFAWTDNEEDQNGNGICTPNQFGYDPDIQVNTITLSGQLP